MNKPEQTKVKRVEPRRLKGFRDYMPQIMAERIRLISKIRDVATLCGFQEIQTPALEYADTILGAGSEETDKQSYRFTDHGDRDVALRFDLTVPFARFVTEHYGELTFPFKKLQMGDVWRGENTQKGRYREFCQCDLDIIGVDSIQADLEILTCFYEILSRMDLGGVIFHINSRPVLSGLIKEAFASVTAEQENKILIALDKLDKIPAEEVAKLIVTATGGEINSALDLVKTLVNADAGVIEKKLQNNPEAGEQFKRLLRTIDLAKKVSDPKAAEFKLDLSIARGLAYYTGIVFETRLKGLDGFGSICSGGRYNDLVNRFSSQILPGVGASIGLDRLVAALEERGQLKAKAHCAVLVAIASDDALAYAEEILWALRRDGVSADIGLVAKLGNQFKYADRLGIGHVITVGGDEMQRKVFGLKDMKSGQEEKDIPMTQLSAKTKNLTITKGGV